MFFQIKHGLAHGYGRVGVYLAICSVQHLVVFTNNEENGSKYIQWILFIKNTF